MTVEWNQPSMIDGWARDTPGVIHAVLLSADGLALASSDDLDPDQAERTAACASGLLGIGAALGRDYAAGRPEILTLRMTTLHFLFVWIADHGALAVAADRDANLGVIGHHMQRLVTALGERLNPAPRLTPADTNRR